MTFYVTFYSFKGGVGRTLALANVAYALVERGKRVALLDLDLEAPGLAQFKEFRLPKGRRAKNYLGFLDYAEAFSRGGRCETIEGHIHKCELDADDGELWLMPAGKRDGRYQERFGELSWRRLHDHEGTLPFIESLKQQLEDHVHPHYVLIDSRTGLSDIGGLSTNLTADMVVLVFNLTKGCIEGSAEACASFLNKDSRPKVVQLVACPVPPSAGGKNDRVEQQLKYAAKQMAGATRYGRDILRVDYDPAMVLAEELAVNKPERYEAAKVYFRIRKRIQAANARDVQNTVEEAYALRSKGRLGEAIERLQAFVERYQNDSEAWLELGDLLLQSGLIDDSIEALSKSCEFAPPYAPPHEALSYWGIALSEAGRAADSSEPLLLEACEKYERAVEIKADKHDAFFCWGNTLAALARAAEGARRKAFFEAALEKYERAVEIKAGYHNALNNWGLTLASLARDAAGDRRRELFESAVEKYERAIEIQADYHVAFSNLGLTLTAMARDASGVIREELLESACEKYKRAIEIKADHHDGFVSWASALLSWWRVSSGTDSVRRAFLEEALDICHQANEIVPHTADYNLACVFSLLGDLDSSTELVAHYLVKHVNMIEHALEDEDFVPLWEARPDFRGLLGRCQSEGNLEPLKSWIEKQGFEAE